MHRTIRALKEVDREAIQRKDSGVILTPKSGRQTQRTPRGAHLRSTSAPHTPVFGSSRREREHLLAMECCNNWADEMDQYDEEREGSMRAKKFKQLMEATTASEAEIISYVRRQSVTLEAPARVISIPGSQFVEEEGELEDQSNSPTPKTNRRRADLQFSSPSSSPPHSSADERSPKFSGKYSPKSMSPTRQKEKGRKGGRGSPASSPKLVRLQTGLCARGPLLPPDYREEDVVRDWNEPIEGLPVPVEDETQLVQPPPPNTHVEVAHDPYRAGGQLHFLVPNNRQNTIRFMRQQFGDPKVRVFMAEYEEDLTAVTIQFLEDVAINPYKGSVPVERIQNVVRTKCPDLYSKVVGRSHGSWKKYVEKHDEVFQLFSVEEGKWRMRLVKHTDYKIGDEQEVAARLAWEAHFTKTLIAHLKSLPTRSCKVDDFMTVYPTLPGNQCKPDGTLEFPLPPRGDLVRFVKRHPQYYTYDQSVFLIGLKGDQ